MLHNESYSIRVIPCVKLRFIIFKKIWSHWLWLQKGCGKCRKQWLFPTNYYRRGMASNRRPSDSSRGRPCHVFDRFWVKQNSIFPLAKILVLLLLQQHMSELLGTIQVWPCAILGPLKGDGLTWSHGVYKLRIARISENKPGHLTKGVEIANT